MKTEDPRLRTVSEAVANMVGAPYDDWRHYADQAKAILTRIDEVADPLRLERTAEALHKLDHPHASREVLVWSAYSEEWKEIYRKRARVAVEAYGMIAPAERPVAEPVILKGVGKITGDGWKDTTKIGEIVFVWNRELDKPYAAGQYPRIGNEIWSASTDQYDFVPASLDEVRFLYTRLSPPKDPQGLVEAMAKAMADRAELDWDAMPDEPDAACGHGMPEGCHNYWHDLAGAALCTLIMRDWMAK